MKVLQGNWQNSSIKKELGKYLPEEIPNSPQRKFASLVVIREFESTAVLTTEGQVLDVELVRAGHNHPEAISRVLLQKRKQVAPERRTGRALNRERRALNREQDRGEECKYMEQMCGKCPDCLIYGYAATSGEGAQRSRVLTDSGFTIRPYEGMQRSITLNAINDTTKGGVWGSAFAEIEHIRPQVFFPTIETVTDVTPAEFLYVLRNILMTTRYGAESNRQGYVKNHVVAILFGEGELLSNLALTQGVYDLLYEQQGEKLHEFPLERSAVERAVLQVIEREVEQAYFPIHLYQGEAVQEMLASAREVWRSEEGKEAWLKELEEVQKKYLLEQPKKKKKK